MPEKYPQKSPYTDMPMKEFGRLCRKGIRDWQKRLGLQSWIIHYKCEEYAGGADGRVNCDLESKVAWIFLNKKTTSPIEEVIGHEMVHIFFAPIHEAIEDVTDALDKYDKTAGSIVWRMFETVMEERVETLRVLLGGEARAKFAGYAGHSDWQEV